MDESGVWEERVFTSARALPPSERDNYLRRVCLDGAVFLRIRSLLDALDRARVHGQQLPTQTSGSADVLVENYRVLEEIGEGGWGNVHRAEQITPLRREVALKIIKLGMDTKTVIRRFEAERQALAMMDHPNIAKVFDAGSTSTGRPYFAMELVPGVKITEFCDLTRSSLRERLTLFLQVCRAIQHAHRKGIVHRDIKPSNVMVTLCNGAPLVKVIDFGVAKAVKGQLTDATFSTAFDGFVGTPEYVSPEQTAFDGPPIDARSDIYSLGVLLYELLCGRTPFALANASARANDSLRQRICAEEPILPSRLLKHLSGDTRASWVQGDQSTRSNLIRQLRGDLDGVVMHCLEKEPSRRYQTVHELAADLQRYLRYEPVIGAQRRVVDSTRRFATRHKAVFASAAAVLAILFMTTIVTTWLAVRAGRANQLAQSIADFVQYDLAIEEFSRYRSSNDLPLVDVLDRATDRVATRFAREPLVEASLRGTLGTAYGSLGENTRSHAQFQRALAIYEEQVGVRDRRTLSAMAGATSSLAKLALYDQAERLGARALTHSGKLFGARDSLTLALETTMAYIWFQRGLPHKSENILRDSSLEQQKTLGPEHPTTLQSTLILAAIHAERGDLAKAEELARAVVESRIRTLGLLHPDSRDAVNALQAIHKRSGKCGYVGQLHRVHAARFEELVVIGRRVRGDHYGLRGLEDTSSRECTVPER